MSLLKKEKKESYKLKVNEVMSGFENKVFFTKCFNSYFKRLNLTTLL